MTEERLTYYFNKYSLSLQNVVYNRLGRYFHDNNLNPISEIYLCPICLVNKVGVIGDYLHCDIDFNIDHFPPSSVGGQQTIFVCVSCNQEAGKNYDYALKEWMSEQSFGAGKPNAKVPMKIEFRETKGIYNSNLSVGLQPHEHVFGNLERYPLVGKRLIEMAKIGQPTKGSFTLKRVNMDHVYKACLKTAYLYCFSIWGYDFVYSETGINIRNILSDKVKHPLANSGCFFHTKDVFPPDGLCYRYMPKEEQVFIISFPIKDISTDLKYSVSVLIPGAEIGCWDNLKYYQCESNDQGEFEMAIIKLPEDSLSDTNLFPYTKLWNDRTTFNIAPLPNAES